jgi:hypothetical protein
VQRICGVPELPIFFLEINSEKGQYIVAMGMDRDNKRYLALIKVWRVDEGSMEGRGRVDGGKMEGMEGMEVGLRVDGRWIVEEAGGNGRYGRRIKGEWRVDGG